MEKLKIEFFAQNAYEVAQQLIGKYICRKMNGEIFKFEITETECYIGINDTACHAHKGKTARTQIMWAQGGVCYVYLCYGIHYMLNFVCGPEDEPMAVLIRGVKGFDGPGKLTKALGVDKSLNGVSLLDSGEIWVEENPGYSPHYSASPRVGIDYAQEQDRNALWRFTITKN